MSAVAVLGDLVLKLIFRPEARVLGLLSSRGKDSEERRIILTLRAPR